MVYIITPCLRPSNLLHIRNTVPTQHCEWRIFYDSSLEVIDWKNLPYPQKKANATGYWGHPVRNYALDDINFNDEDWIHFLDDDNIIHPRWWESVEPHLTRDVAMLTWGQLYKGAPRLEPTTEPRTYYVDTATFMVKWKYCKNIRWTQDYFADGIFAEEVAKQGEVFAINEYVSYYNFLSPNKE